MDTRGFTLIELLAVIIILAILVTITAISVSSILSNSEDSVSDIQKNKIENAAKVYYLKVGMNNNETCVSVQTLINTGYIEGSEVIDPKTKEAINGSVRITHSISNDQYSYAYQSSSCE